MIIIEALGKAIEVIEKWVPMFEQCNTPAAIQDAITLLQAQEPVDAVPVVRCKDCKHWHAELAVFPQLFGSIVNGMEEHPDCDFLGELYMELEMGNKHTGQFFTPYDLCRMMARCNLHQDLIEAEMARQGYISINDCACGAGATLVAAANYLKEIGFDYQRDALFVGQDIDSTTALMCYIQLSLLGCAGYVIIGDTLAAPQTGPVLMGEDSSRCWLTPMYILHSWRARRTPAQVGYEKPEETQPTFTVSMKKKNAGQIMFDFGR